MKVSINFLPEFFRQAKALRKKYASFERDFQLLCKYSVNAVL